MNILIVEEDLISRELLQDILKPYGTCHAAANGAEALIAVDGMHDRNDPYKLIYLDIMMPAMNGQVVLKKIREIERQRAIAGSDAVKIIMVSASDDPKNSMNALVRGSSDGCLTRPIDLAQMEKLLGGLGIHPLTSEYPSLT